MNKELEYPLQLLELGFSKTVLPYTAVSFRYRQTNTKSPRTKTYCNGLEGNIDVGWTMTNIETGKAGIYRLTPFPALQRYWLGGVLIIQTK